jgi:hypothetical protein
LQIRSFYLEYGNPDDEYDSLQNHDLHLEHDASLDDSFVDDATLSIIKTDGNDSAMAKAAEDQNIIEKTAWGNESSMIFFIYGKSKRACCHPVCGVECNKTLQVDIK